MPKILLIIAASLVMHGSNIRAADSPKPLVAAKKLVLISTKPRNSFTELQEMYRKDGGTAFAVTLLASLYVPAVIFVAAEAAGDKSLGGGLMQKNFLKDCKTFRRAINGKGLDINTKRAKKKGICQLSLQNPYNKEAQKGFEKRGDKERALSIFKGYYVNIPDEKSCRSMCGVWRNETCLAIDSTSDVLPTCVNYNATGPESQPIEANGFSLLSYNFATKHYKKEHKKKCAAFSNELRKKFPDPIATGSIKNLQVMHNNHCTWSLLNLGTRGLVKELQAKKPDRLALYKAFYKYVPKNKCLQMCGDISQTGECSFNLESKNVFKTCANYKAQ